MFASLTTFFWSFFSTDNPAGTENSQSSLEEDSDQDDDSESIDSNSELDGTIVWSPGTRPSVDDVFAVRYCLLRFLPRELADVVLEAAAYWPSVFIEDTTQSTLHANSQNANNAAVYRVITPPIEKLWRGPDTEAPTVVQKVVFTLESCDQGWGGDVNNQNTYEGSYTWFEAAIVRTNDTERFDYIMNADLFNARAFRALNPAERENTLETSGRWHLQSNIQVSRKIRQHEIMWTRADVIDQNAARAKGRGTGRGFVDTLALGDRVAVVARAQFPEWVNHISSIKIEVFYSA